MKINNLMCFPHSSSSHVFSAEEKHFLWLLSREFSHQISIPFLLVKLRKASSPSLKAETSYLAFCLDPCSKTHRFQQSQLFSIKWHRKTISAKLCLHREPRVAQSWRMLAQSECLCSTQILIYQLKRIKCRVRESKQIKGLNRFLRT